MIQVGERVLKLAFLILTAQYEPWKTLLKEGPQKTWANREMLDSSHLAFGYVGKPLKGLRNEIENNISIQEKTYFLKNRERLLEYSAKFSDYQTIQVPFYDTWNTMYEKFILSSRLLLDTFEFDFLVRVNTTTYVDVESLMLWLSLHQDVDYGGVQSKQKKFFSGWGIVFSRRALRRLVENANKTKIIKSIYDDEIIGNAMSELGFVMSSIPSLTFETSEAIEKFEIQNSAPFMRMKVSQQGVRTDFQLMQLLHQKYSKND